MDQPNKKVEVIPIPDLKSCNRVTVLSHGQIYHWNRTEDPDIYEAITTWSLTKMPKMKIREKTTSFTNDAGKNR